jgi:hypothetical protein
MVTAAVSEPVVVGVKCPWIRQFAPAARLVPQLLANPNEEAPVPVTAMLVMASVALPVLVKVTLCEALVVPTSWLPNDKLVADSETVVLTPVPPSEMLCGEPVALSVMVMAAVNGPTAAGVKCPWIEQFAPAARLVPQLLENTNEDASVPVTTMLVIDSAEVPVLVNVTLCEALVVLTS